MTNAYITGRIHAAYEDSPSPLFLSDPEYMAGYESGVTFRRTRAWKTSSKGEVGFPFSLKTK